MYNSDKVWERRTVFELQYNSLRWYGPIAIKDEIVWVVIRRYYIETG